MTRRAACVFRDDKEFRVSLTPTQRSDLLAPFSSYHTYLPPFSYSFFRLLQESINQSDRKVELSINLSASIQHVAQAEKVFIVWCGRSTTGSSVVIVLFFFRQTHHHQLLRRRSWIFQCPLLFRISHSSAPGSHHDGWHFDRDPKKVSTAHAKTPRVRFAGRPCAQASVVGSKATPQWHGEHSGTGWQGIEF